MKKLNYEYEIARLEMIRTSRENIYSHAKEILLKQLINKCAPKMNFSEEETLLLLSEYNLTDSIYMRLAELPIEEYVEEVISAVINQLEEDVFGRNSN